jgi:hypothetical protein
MFVLAPWPASPPRRTALVPGRESSSLLYPFIMTLWVPPEANVTREDVKCVIPDDRPRDEGEGPPFICVRSRDECVAAMRFAAPL